MLLPSSPPSTTASQASRSPGIPPAIARYLCRFGQNASEGEQRRASGCEQETEREKGASARVVPLRPRHPGITRSVRRLVTIRTKGNAGTHRRQTPRWHPWCSGPEADGGWQALGAGLRSSSLQTAQQGNDRKRRRESGGSREDDKRKSAERTSGREKRSSTTKLDKGEWGIVIGQDRTRKGRERKAASFSKAV